MLSKLNLLHTKLDSKYELPINKPMSELTIQEVQAICHAYSKNHKDCPFYDEDPYGCAACMVKISLWGCDT